MYSTPSVWLAGLIAGLTLVLAPPSRAAAVQHVKARLVSEVGQIAPGQVFWVALDFSIEDGWHTYWRNPGDSGLATRLTWHLPPGFTAGEIQWAAPHRFELSPLINFGYSGHAEHLVKITVPQNLPTGSAVNLAAQATWLACSAVCVPESAQLQLRLATVGAAQSADPAVAGLFSRARGELPVVAGGTSTARIDQGGLSIRLGSDWGPVLAQISSLMFFPYDDGVIDYAAPQTLARMPNAVELTVKARAQSRKVRSIRGVMVATWQNGAQNPTTAYEISAAL